MNPVHDFYEFNFGKTNYRFLTTGDIFQFTCGDIMLNQFRGNPKDGSVNNIYLRIYKDGEVKAYPLLGIQSGSVLEKGEHTLVYRGTIEGIAYKVIFRGSDRLWFWDMELSGKGETVDLLYGQDIGIASLGGVLTNELYTAQYLGHSVFTSEDGYVICSRQNQEQGKLFPYFQQGAFGIKALHYSTDGLQFFGTSYKAANIPASISGDLPDVNYQFEFSYTGLQTEKLILGTKQQAVFYGYFEENHKDAVTELEYRDWIKENLALLRREEETKPCEKIQIKESFGQPYASPELSQEEIFQLFPAHLLEEYEKDTLLSFFTKDHSHVVTQKKELAAERPHGTILTTLLNTKKVDTNLITSTNYMYGLFNGQTVAGNTSFHKFLSTPRGLLNIQKNCGQHLYVKLNGTYRLLTLPAIYEMGMNYSRWYYVLPSDLLIITAFTAAERPDIILEAESKKGMKYDFILTNQLVMGENEFLQEIHKEEIPGGCRFTLDSKTYPGLHYDLQIPEVPFFVSDDRIFFTDDSARDETFLTINLKQQSYFQCIISGRLCDTIPEAKTFYSFEKEKSLYQDFYRKLNRFFHLKSTSGTYDKKLDILNETAWWYSHNAMVHFAVPHGLEQPGGAAWGTRDVCQGPMEFFLMTQNYDLAGDVLINIFSHQSETTGEWPQWFMFDRYRMDAGECHGDVVFWPLKCMGDYLKACGNTSLLEERLCYADNPDSRDTLLEHMKKAFSAIQNRFIEDTGLITYAGGDWDDTLQPADPVMKEHLVSAWTVALAYQTLKSLGQALLHTDAAFASQLTDSAEKIHQDFQAYLIKDKVIAGFVRKEKDDFLYMLHPADKETGINYRLLPMTRSIIAELAEPEQAKENMTLIQRELKCPDGVRLMNKPARYSGGVSKLFKRAEQAANVGREISLQYTHAHIRYIEACAKLGNRKEAWNSLFTINPILIKESVPNACTRQSNLYFSSSDGLYMDRYDYAENFNRLREGTIPVKGGWRLYSSGPGIYLNQLISNVLGIRFEKDYLILDPVLPEAQDGLAFTYTCFGRTYTFCYHINGSSMLRASSDGMALQAEAMDNPYRKGGIRIHKDDLKNCSSVIDVFL